MDAGVPSET